MKLVAICCHLAEADIRGTALQTLQQSLIGHPCVCRHLAEADRELPFFSQYCGFSPKWSNPSTGTKLLLAEAPPHLSF